MVTVAGGGGSSGGGSGSGASSGVSSGASISDCGNRGALFACYVLYSALCCVIGVATMMTSFATRGGGGIWRRDNVTPSL